MVLEYSFTKAKIPRGMSFPLKRSALDERLLDAGVTAISNVYYGLQQHSGRTLIRAIFLGEGSRGWSGAGLTSISIYAVPSEERQAAETALISDVLPRLMRWLAELEHAGNVRRGVAQSFVAEWREGWVCVEAS